MIDLHRLAKILREITPDEVLVLQTLEDMAHRFEYIPIDEIAKRTALEKDEVIFHLGSLNKVGLVKRSTEHYLGYRMTQSGYDTLSLYELAHHDIVVELGQPYGVGKESTVYRARNAEGQEVAVKFLRWGRTSFRQVRRLRSVQDDYIRSWMEYSKQAAEREYTALRKITDVKGKVPKPIAINRHIIVMSQMIGELLLDILELKNPRNVLKETLQQIKLVYQEAQIIHGDLSEYNIFVDEKEAITLFDWPQWQPISHPNALWLLKRDVSHILNFFKRRFRLILDIDHEFQKITGKSIKDDEE